MFGVCETPDGKYPFTAGPRDLPKLRAMCLGVLVMMAGGLAHAEDVAVELTAYAVTVSADGEEELSPTTEVNPGGIIEYEIDYRNLTDDPLDNFTVLGDVPDETTYVSVTAIEGFDSELEVHVPDIGWSLEPVIRYVQDETGALVPTEVQPEEYDALRWRMPNALAPGEEISVSYRIRVNN